MKKKLKQIILILAIIMMILVLAKPVNAATNYDIEIISSAEEVKEGQEVVITIKVKDINGINGGIAGLSAKLEYDTTKLEKVGEGVALNGFIIVEGNTIELVKYPGVTADTEVAKFTFKAKTEGTARIKLTELEVANGEETFPLGKEVTKTITISKINSPVQPNPLSNNKNLSSLKVDGRAVSGFDRDILNYTLEEVEYSKDSIKIEASAEDEKATIQGTGTKQLNVGKNSFNIIVTAEDGTQKTYTINIERKESTKEENKEDDKEESIDTEEKNDKDTNEENTSQQEQGNTQAENKIPHAGIESYILFIILGVSGIVAVIFNIKVRLLSDI